MTENGQRVRVVITGMGIIGPLGQTVEEYWRNLVNGVSGIDYITRFDASKFPCVVAGEVKNFNPEDHLTAKQARRLARFAQLAVGATRIALQDADLKLEQEDKERIGVILGNGIGSFPDMEEQGRVLFERGHDRVSPTFMPKMLPNMAAGNVAITFGLYGYNNTVITACAAGTQAIGDAAEIIRHGRADVMVTGGTEAGICALGLASFCAMRALSNRKDDPKTASRPFDAQRDGFVPGEGSAILILERLDRALARGAPILAEVLGYAASSDAFDLVQPHETGDGAARTMRWALKDASLTPADIDYINAHGTATPIGDAAETLGIKKVFGEGAYNIPVNSTKSMTGHLLGAAGAIEAVAVVQTLRTGTIHPTINLENPDPACDLDYVPNQARQKDVKVALSNSFGFGGQNACLVFGKYHD